MFRDPKNVKKMEDHLKQVEKNARAHGNLIVPRWHVGITGHQGNVK